MDEDVSSNSGVASWTLVLLNRILEKKGKKDIREVWPNLELLMHGGVSFKPYEKEFRKIIPHDDMHYIESYNASEGFRSEEHTSELQSRPHLVCRLLLEKKKN